MTGLLLAWLLVAGIWINLTLIFRNGEVRRYRQFLLSQIERAVTLDALEGFDDYQWRLDAYEAVSYARMVVQFWRNIESFYPDLGFIRPRRRER